MTTKPFSRTRGIILAAEVFLILIGLCIVFGILAELAIRNDWYEVLGLVSFFASFISGATSLILPIFILTELTRFHD